jgi:L-iditol 2-dehydrogenase
VPGVIGLVKVAHGNPELELRDVALGDVGPEDVVVRVRLAGICGTDIHIARDEFPSWPPVVLGHEFTGVVERTGSEIDPALIGARVVAEPHARACHECFLCRQGHPELCAQKRSPGWGMDGAFAPLVVVPAWLLHAVPDGLPDRAAVLAEPMAVVMTALRRSRLAAGDHVLVIGPGPVGLLAALAARAAGAASVTVAGRQLRGRLDVATRLGFAVTTIDEAGATMRERTGDRGADLVVEATGSAIGVAAAVDAVRRRGRLAAIGLTGQQSISVPWDLATTRAIDVAFAMSSNYEAWEPALSILERIATKAASLVTIYPLPDWRTAFQAVSDRSVIKAVLDPGPQEVALP